MSTMMKTYEELSRLNSFEDRFEYLKLKGCVGQDTFGFDRYLNQQFYSSQEWRVVRDYVILRDNGCDLGVEGYEIPGKVVIHHLNPITQQDIIDRTEKLLNPEYMVCCSHNTHNAIHFGDASLLPRGPIIRRPGDTCPWK